MRLTIRGMVAVVALVGLLLSGVAYRQRIRARAYALLNQDIRLRGAEADLLNAGLARESANDAVDRYVREHGDRDNDPKLTSLRAAAKEARRHELALKANREDQKDQLGRLIRQLYDSGP
jgi:hypothetical protein